MPSHRFRPGEKISVHMINKCHLTKPISYRENRELRHIPFRRGRFFVGTAKYASLNSHKNIELSRRDDLVIFTLCNSLMIFICWFVFRKALVLIVFNFFKVKAFGLKNYEFSLCINRTYKWNTSLEGSSDVTYS